VEFLAEILVALVQLLCEFLLQLAAQALAGLGWYSVREALRPSSPPLRIPGLLGHAVIGTILGGLSLLIFPQHFAISTALRITTVVVAPLMSALAVVPTAGLLRRFFPAINIRWWFGNAYMFGLSFALVRFIGAN
jgi:hypothetical protein